MLHSEPFLSKNSGQARLDISCLQAGTHRPIGPWSVESWHGGSIDEMKIPQIEKMKQLDVDVSPPANIISLSGGSRIFRGGEPKLINRGFWPPQPPFGPLIGNTS